VHLEITAEILTDNWRKIPGDADNDDERIVVVGLEEAATKQEGRDEEEDQN
jgi:hypothetical protein